MTDEILVRCNKLKSRINEVDAILKEIEAVNTVTGEKMTLPICIQAGIQNPTEFFFGEEFSDPSLYEVDLAVYKLIVDTLKNYRDRLQQTFEDIRDY